MLDSASGECSAESPASTPHNQKHWMKKRAFFLFTHPLVSFPRCCGGSECCSGRDARLRPPAFAPEDEMAPARKALSSANKWAASRVPTSPVLGSRAFLVEPIGGMAMADSAAIRGVSCRCCIYSSSAWVIPVASSLQPVFWHCLNKSSAPYRLSANLVPTFRLRRSTGAKESKCRERRLAHQS